MAADLLPHLFRKFSRIDGDDRESGIAGSGLGLAICKGIVEAHGGRIRAESGGPGLGARFTLTLPVVGEPGSGAATGPARLSGRSRASEAEQVRILAVDDDPPGAPVCPGRPLQSGLHSGCDHRPGGGAAPHGGGRSLIWRCWT